MSRSRIYGEPPNPLRRHRLVAGIRLRDLRVATGLSESTLGRIERGERAVSPSEAETLSHALSVAVPRLFTADGQIVNDRAEQERV